MSTAHRAKAVQRGFTLVELVVVIVIIGILAATAAPRFFSNRPYAERGYADELASALRNAQKIAVASGCWVAVIVNPAGYQALQRGTGTNCAVIGSWTTPVMRGDGTALSGSAPSSAAVAGTTTFIFDGAGHLQGTVGSIQIGPYAVTVLPTTGLVSVQ